MKSPNNLLNDLAERAAILGHLISSNRGNLGKPGEFFNSLTDEEKEVLRQLKSDDIDVRFDSIKDLI